MSTKRRTAKRLRCTLAHNPSHLEAVDPVVEGRTRALQTDHSRTFRRLRRQEGCADSHSRRCGLHRAKASSPKCSICSRSRDTQTGGTLHIIANNQIGFTTDPRDSRSTRYSCDLSKGFDVPIVHVNADDVDACISAVQLAVEFRKQFGRDVLIDLIGYRRFGHNEQDEPAYTQPSMYDKIKAHPTARELFANKLIAQGSITAEASATKWSRRRPRAFKKRTRPIKGGKAAGHDRQSTAADRRRCRRRGDRKSSTRQRCSR